MRVSLQQQRNPHPNAPRTFLPLAPRTPAAPARRHSRRRQPRCAPSGLGTAAGRCAAWDSPTSSALPVSPRDALGTAPSGQPHPPHRRRCPGQPRNAPRSAHLPPRQCRATARGAACKLSSSPGLRAVRCGAERPAPELCSRRSPAAATRGGGRGGSTGTASFSSGRPPPSAEPRGASGGYGAGRGGTGRAAGRRGGLHLRLRAEAGDGGCRHLHELTSHPLQRIAPRVSPSPGGAHLARGRARLLSPCLSVRSLEAHTCARAVLHPPRTHLCAHTHSCSFRDYGPPSCRPSTRTGSSCAALSTHTHP